MKIIGTVISRISTVKNNMAGFCSKIKRFHAEVINDGVRQGLINAQNARKGNIGKEIEIYKSIFQKAQEPVIKNMKGVGKMPKEIVSVWKSDASIGLKAKNTYSKGVKPYLPGLLAYAGLIFPAPGSTSAGFFIGQVLKHIT